MKSFKLVLPYVFQQWPLLGIIIFAALINSILFSATIATIIPLLKVMMGQEGLHGWADRTIASQRYGISFYVPDKQDLASDPKMNNYLRVVSVKNEKPAEKSGIRTNDLIISAAEPNTVMTSAEML